MHEFGIAQGLLDAVLAKAQEIGAPRVISIRLEIGALAGVETGALTFAFAALAHETPAASAHLRIENIPVRCYCSTCETEFECRPADYACPKCGRTSTDVRSGRELRLISMEVD